MKRGPIIHGVLLVATAAFAYQTWTRDKTVKVERAQFVLWDGRPADIVSVDYDVKDKRTIHIERRSDDQGSYLWGIATRTTIIPAKKSAPGGDQAGAGARDAGVAEPEPQPEVKTTTKEFPVGESGDKLLEGLAPMRALRELGALTDEQRKEYGLEDAGTQLTVNFQSGSHTLILGGRVYGGNDRYAVDPATGTAYVIPGDVLQPLSGGESVLRENKIFPFDPDDVATVTIRTGDVTKTLVRRKKPAEQPHGPEQVVWAYADRPDEPDQTLANFMARVDRLAPSDYQPELTREGLTEVVRIDYADKDGKSLGHIELLKKPGEREGTFDYYVFSERTRVLAKTYPGTAKRVDEDLKTIFSQAE